MIKINVKLLFFIISLALSACSAPDNRIYYWGDYSETAYTYSHNPSQESLHSHIQSLLNIVEHAADKNKRVPPGIYAELGVLTGNDDQNKAVQYFQREKELFPESSILMDRMINQLGSEIK